MDHLIQKCPFKTPNALYQIYRMRHSMAQLNAPVEVGAAKFLNITVPLRGAILRDGEKCASERQVDNAIKKANCPGPTMPLAAGPFTVK